MIKFLATRRWNYIDIFGLSICIGLSINHRWFEWLLVCILTLIISLVVEHKAGIE